MRIFMSVFAAISPAEGSFKSAPTRVIITLMSEHAQAEYKGAFEPDTNKISGAEPVSERFPTFHISVFQFFRFTAV
jgi:hypothetical protein